MADDHFNESHSADERQIVPHVQGGRWREVLLVFLRLGLTSFGGPVAHIGYFREECVARRKWLDEAQFADLVALCQFLPGPASSQLGFALGLMRGGALGACMAWCAFTLPSALLLLAFAYGAFVFEGPLAMGIIHGLKLVAVAVVGQAVWSMARSLTPDAPRLGIALIALGLAIWMGGAFVQIALILSGALAGLWLCRKEQNHVTGHLSFAVSRKAAIVCLVLFGLLFIGPPLLYQATQDQAFILFDAFFRPGALVFGGGHVVLPLLQASMVEPGWTDPDTFLAGYAAAQAVPGPLFTFAAYLGAVAHIRPNGFWGGSIALVAIFLPGFLLLLAALPYWDRLRLFPAARSAMRGVNAVVVGILAAALYDPVWTSAVAAPVDVLLVLLGFAALVFGKVPAWLIVLLGAATGLAVQM